MAGLITQPFFTSAKNGNSNPIKLDHPVNSNSSFIDNFQVSKNMFIKKVNIFLLSLVIAISPTLVHAIDPIVRPFTTAPAAADIAASLGARATGGFASASIGVGLTVAAAIGVGAASFCYASMIQGANSCGASSAICEALTAAIISCKPNADGTFDKASPSTSGEAPPSTGQYLYYIPSCYNAYPCTAEQATNIGSLISQFIAYADSGSSPWTHAYKSAAPNAEPYTSLTFSRKLKPGNYGNENDLTVNVSFIQTNIIPEPEPETEKATPSEVGNAIAGHPAAANALGAAANAAADSSCNGSLGTFNGVTTCVPALGASNNPTCNGYYGVVNGKNVCVPALGAGGNSACAGYSGSVNGVSTCIPEIGNNPACNGYLGTFNGNTVCVGGTDTSAYNPATALSDANAAASAASANPPATRTCAVGYQLQASGICLNTAIPQPNSNTDCKIGYVFYNNNCVVADPLNPYKPATSETPASSIPSTTTTTTTTDATTGIRTTTTTTTEVRDGVNVPVRTVVTTLNPATGAETKTDTGFLPNPKTATAEKPALPAFCGWASVVCDLVAFIKKEPTAPTNTTVTVTSVGVTGTALDDYDISQKRVNFIEQCPVPINFSFDFMGHSQALSYSFEPFCEFLTKIKPIIIACAYVGGAYIVSGATRKSDS